MLRSIEESSEIHINHDIVEIDKIQLQEEKSVRIYRIIQELTTNTLKHAKASAIKLDASLKHDILELTYQDNGVSFYLDKWKSSDNSVGLRSIIQRLGYLEGNIKFEKPKKGFKVILSIKIKRT